MPDLTRQQARSRQGSPSTLIEADAATNVVSNPPHMLLQLQSTLGNRAVQRLLQSRPVGIQAKPTNGTSEDVYEREAEQAAEQVMSRPGPPLQRACACGEGCPDCRKEQTGQERLQRKPLGAADTAGALGLPAVDEALRSTGRPLDSSTREFMEPRFGHDFSRVRVHTDDRAVRSVNALAFTVGRDIVFGAGRYAPETAAGQRLLAHELAHVVQQGSGSVPSSVQRFHIPHGTDPDHQVSEVPKIAPTFKELLETIKAIIKAASRPGTFGDAVNMDLFVQLAGGRPASAQLDKKLGTESTAKVASMLDPRYLFTCRCGLLDMRHFLQLMYISHFFASAFPGAAGANRAATKQGREHELHAESESQFGPEDIPSNALGAFTGTRLAVNPLADDLLKELETTLRRCDPVDFSSLSKTSQDLIVHHYGDLIPDPSSTTGELIPAHQNQTAVPDVLGVPECGGRERSFPFELDADDPHRKTVSGRAFGSGSTGLTGDSEIRDFVSTQRAEIIKALPASEKVRLVKRLFGGVVSDEDIDAIEVVYKNSDAPEKAQIKGAIDPADLLGPGQRARLRLLFS